MVSKVFVNIFYVCDNFIGSLFKRIYVIKMANDKIEEINFNMETRIKSRNDIDTIIKNVDSVTVCIKYRAFFLSSVGLTRQHKLTPRRYTRFSRTGRDVVW